MFLWVPEHTVYTDWPGARTYFCLCDWKLTELSVVLSKGKPQRIYVFLN